jgi:hypothetical protein
MSGLTILVKPGPRAKPRPSSVPERRQTASQAPPQLSFRAPPDHLNFDDQQHSGAMKRHVEPAPDKVRPHNFG